VLWLRSLEPADAPLNFGTKLALAIGTARRLDHDESEKVFGFCCNHDTAGAVEGGGGQQQQGPALVRANSEGVGFVAGSASGSSSGSGSGSISGGTAGAAPVPLSGTSKKSVDVYVREKVRVESADPSLLSLSAKLTALSHTLALARRNLAAVLGEEMESED